MANLVATYATADLVALVMFAVGWECVLSHACQRWHEERPLARLFAGFVIGFSVQPFVETLIGTPPARRPPA